MADVRCRIKKFLKYKGLSQKEFTERIGVSTGYVNAISKGIGQEKIYIIRESYPDLNIDWLMTGEGEMIKGQSGNTIVTGDVSGNGNNIVAGNGNQIAASKIEDAEVVDAEDVEIKETAIVTPEILKQTGVNLKRALEDGTLGVEVKPTQDVLPPHNAKVYTETDEMSPEIDANDPVFVELLSSPQNFEDGRMYLVNLYHGSFVRWVVRADATHVTLYSMKSERTVAISDIKSMAEVVAVTKRPKTLPKHRITMADVIAHKDAQLAEVNAQINSTLNQNSRLIGLLEKQLNK